MSEHRQTPHTRHYRIAIYFSSSPHIHLPLPVHAFFLEPTDCCQGSSLPVRSCPWLSMQQYPFPYFFSLAAFLCSRSCLCLADCSDHILPNFLQYPQRISQVFVLISGWRWEQWPRQLRLTCGKFWTKPGGRVQFLESVLHGTLISGFAAGWWRAPVAHPWRLASYMFR